MDGTRLDRASPLIKGRAPKKDPSRESGFVERTTMFVVAMKKEDGDALLEGFASEPRQRARVFAQQLAALDSPTRQARLALEFGVREGGRERVNKLMGEVSPALRAAIIGLLPQTWRPATPTLRNPPSPVMLAIAARLIREATR
ncbi:MAG: hypothetical protein GQE15_28365 [Archangiaceae bacterium]|nr:hypothetical protein [Archangiaceae bacterium]